MPVNGEYVALLAALFLLPRILVRFRIPAAITALALGAMAGAGLGWFVHDSTVGLLSTLGIVALFLFAGLDVDFDELLVEKRVIAQHLVLRLVSLAVLAVALQLLLGLSLRVATLVALAVLTPSTGFILDSLDALGLTDRERFWIRSQSIAAELVALFVLFVTLQSTSAQRLGLAALALAAIVVLLPLVFRGFARLILPYAPKSEFAFLLLIAVICAMATRELGVYYLVGAFLVGVVAQRFRERLPAMTSEKMLHALEVFATIFVPFYFFHAGLELRPEDMGPAAVLAGAAFLVAGFALRVGAIMLHRRLILGEPVRVSARIALSMAPTLVFTLVIAGILRERFQAPPWLFGGLIVYALVNTTLPSFILRTPPPEFETPNAPPVDGESALEAGIDSGRRPDASS